MSHYLKKHPWLVWLALVVVATGFSLVIVRAQKNVPPAAPAAPAAAAGPVPVHPVIIKPGPATPRVDTGLKDASGNAITASCSTCHSTTTPNTARNTSADLIQSHRGLTYKHVDQTCLS